MAHEKVYGICDAKCKVEVLPKENFLIIPLEGTTPIADGNMTGSNYMVVKGLTSNDVPIAVLYNRRLWVNDVASLQDFWLDEIFCATDTLGYTVRRTSTEGALNCDLSLFEVVILKGIRNDE